MIKSVRVQFDKHMATTHKAYLLRFGTKEYWFPRRLCRGFVVNQKLGGNVAIPAWLYMEKFGQEPDEEIAEITIVHHVPARIKAHKIEADASLIK